MTKLKLNDLLIENINTWGNVEYNIPLRSSYTETRSTASVGHRYIPPATHYVDCRVSTPLPDRVKGRDMEVAAHTYRTTSGDYSYKTNPYKPTERNDCSINCRRVIFMTGVDKMLQRKDITNPAPTLSEVKDNYRATPPPPAPAVEPPDTKYVFDIVACGRNEAPTIPETAKGHTRLLDPYVTTYRTYHVPFTVPDQFKSKDQITYYSEAKLHRSKGFGPRYKPVWDPILEKRHRPVFDKVILKKEYREIPNCHNPANWLKNSFKTENRLNYLNPYTRSTLVTWTHGEEPYLTPYPPNPYQTDIVPSMYCSDYCHISQGTSTHTVVDQVDHIKPRKPYQI